VQKIYRAEEVDSLFGAFVLVGLNLARLALRKKIYPRMFKYTEINSNHQRVYAKGAFAVAAKTSFLFLNLDDANAFKTREIIQSATLDKIEFDNEMRHLKAVYQGDAVPFKTCHSCRGTKKAWFRFTTLDVDGQPVWVPVDISRVGFLERYSDPTYRFEECATCKNKGYFDDPAHPDIARAKELAVKYGWKK
jgi:hypothetical protein